MSRIGKRIIKIPDNTKIICENNLLKVSGPKGELSRQFSNNFEYKISEKEITIIPKKALNQKETMLYGTINSHIYNMVVGVTTGYKKTLIIIGVGYRCKKIGNELIFQLGFSHNIKLPIPEGIKVEVLKQTKLIVEGIDKEKVGAFCAYIHGLKKPEPYLGKGIRYENENVIRKEGKKAGK